MDFDALWDVDGCIGVRWCEDGGGGFEEEEGVLGTLVVEFFYVVAAQVSEVVEG